MESGVHPFASIFRLGRGVVNRSFEQVDFALQALSLLVGWFDDFLLELPGLTELHVAAASF